MGPVLPLACTGGFRLSAFWHLRAAAGTTPALWQGLLIIVSGRTGPAPLTHPWGTGTDQGAPSLTLPWVCSMAPSNAASPDWCQLAASKNQPPCIHLPHKPYFSDSKMRVVFLIYKQQKCGRL